MKHKELPESPDGWTKTLVMHMRMQGGSGAVYEVFDADGKKVPEITSVYNTSKTDGYRGFRFNNGERVYTWAELREAWPGLIASESPCPAPSAATPPPA